MISVRISAGSPYCPPHLDHRSMNSKTGKVKEHFFKKETKTQKAWKTRGPRGCGYFIEIILDLFYCRPRSRLVL